METFFIQYILISFVHSPPKLSQVLPPPHPSNPTLLLSLSFLKQQKQNKTKKHTVCPQNTKAESRMYKKKINKGKNAQAKQYMKSIFF